MNKPLKAIFYRDWDNDHVSDILKEIFWEKLYAPLVVDKKDLTIVDCGANIGLFTLWMYPYAKKIYSVEPSALHCETLGQMVKFNQMDKVEIIQKALADKDGEMKFYHNDNTTMFMLQNLSGSTTEAETVQTATIGTLLKDIPHIDILKIDIEGAEGTVFANSSFDEVAPKIDNIVLEYHNWSGISVALLMNTIRDRGFSVEQIPTQATVLWFKKQ
jgi:FkbM family methyltransferase